jgi:hypothetical protein
VPVDRSSIIVLYLYYLEIWTILPRVMVYLCHGENVFGLHGTFMLDNAMA